jgi:hypothetical protein
MKNRELIRGIFGVAGLWRVAAQHSHACSCYAEQTFSAHKTKAEYTAGAGIALFQVIQNKTSV